MGADHDEGDDEGVFVQQYDAAGVVQGSEFLVNTTTDGNQQYSSLAMDDNGDFVVIWSGNGVSDAEGVFGQRYAAAGANQAPVAIADSYSIDEDFVLNVNPVAGVLSNDTDAESDPLTVVLVSGPSNGTLTLNANGQFTYNSDDDFAGIDSFTYKANDGTFDSNNHCQSPERHSSGVQ